MIFQNLNSNAYAYYERAATCRDDKNSPGTGRVWVDSDLLCEQNDSALFLGDKLCSAMFRSSTTRGVDEYSHVFASVTGISRFAVVE